MMGLIGQIRAERRKMRHTMLPWLHVVLPLVGCGMFLFYYQISKWSVLEQIAGYVEVIGVALPIAVAVSCAAAVELEEKNHFQTFLGVAAKRGSALWAKLAVLIGMEIGAIALAVGGFAAGSRLLGGPDALAGSGGTMEQAVYLYAGLTLALCLSGIPLYFLHLFLNLRFSKTVAIGVGVAESLVAALFLTGLGDGLWQLFPCSWAARWGILLTGIAGGLHKGSWIISYIRNAMCSCLLITAAICAIILVWFHFYEGRYSND